MTKYIDKDALVAELNRLIAELVEEGEDTMFEQGRISAFEDAKLFLDTLEVKEIHEDIDVDLNSFFEELGVESDSRLASMIKKAFYEGIDKYLNGKENKL